MIQCSAQASPKLADHFAHLACHDSACGTDLLSLSLPNSEGASRADVDKVVSYQLLQV
jgi:hypothetical protein